MTSTAADIAPSDFRRVLPYALVVDDDPVFRTLLVGMLKHAYQVCAVGDGQEGFYRALECPPVVAVIDVQMPNWSGLKLLRTLRDQATLNNIAVVMLTSDASRETVMAAIQAGTDEYVIKSALTRGDLLEKISRARRLRHGAVIENSVVERLHEPVSVVASDATSKCAQEVIDAWE